MFEIRSDTSKSSVRVNRMAYYLINQRPKEIVDVISTHPLVDIGTPFISELSRPNRGEIH